MAKTKIEIDTTEYRASHLSEPRGRGGWLWLFDEETDISKSRCFNGGTTYAEARTAAIEYARANGHTVARVMP